MPRMVSFLRILQGNIEIHEDGSLLSYLFFLMGQQRTILGGKKPHRAGYAEDAAMRGISGSHLERRWNPTMEFNLQHFRRSQQKRLEGCRLLLLYTRVYKVIPDYASSRLESLLWIIMSECDFLSP